jgi:phosphate transport system substrate-binding protein
VGNRYLRVGRAAGIAALALAYTASATLAAGPAVPSGDAGTISGIGATFPAPLYNEWFSQFKEDHPSANVSFTYAANGSGAGVKAIKDQTADYGASDAALSDADVASTSGTNGGVLTIPATIGGVVLAYKVKGVHTTTGKATTLKLTKTVVGKIFSGQITFWNDAAIKAINPKVVIPHTAIVPVHRSDSSGTTFVFETYLAKVSTAWKCILGSAGAVKVWPSSPGSCTGKAKIPGLGAPRNSGVAAKVGSTNGAIGYMEYAYARNAGLKMARIKNPAGVYVSPTTYGFSAAAAATLGKVPSDLRAAPIVQAPGTSSWPISSYSFLMVYKHADGLQNATETKAQMFVSYLYWSLTTGQSFARSMGYAPLPSAVKTKALNQVHKITWNGSAIWP